MPQVGMLEGRALLSTMHPYARIAPAAMHWQAAWSNWRASAATGTPLAPGQFGPNTPYPFAGVRPGGYVLRSFSPTGGFTGGAATPQTSSSAANSNAATMVTPLAPGQFGPNTPFPFAGVRPGGYVLR